MRQRRWEEKKGGREALRGDVGNIGRSWTTEALGATALLPPPPQSLCLRKVHG